MAPPLTLTLATSVDALAVARLRSSVAIRLTETYGRGHWSSLATERGAAWSIETSMVYLAWSNRRPIATFRLATSKPWAIDARYFSRVKRPLYLTDMAVAPADQGRGIGRWSLKEAVRLARLWPADAIRLDAYGGAAGAGGFYHKCGFREVGRATYRGVELLYYELLLA